MASTNCEGRRALRKLASQACSEKASRAHATSTDKGNSRTIAALIATGLTVSLGWMMYSHWQQRPSAETKSGHAPAEIQPGRAPSSMKNSAWTIAHKATGGSASAPVEMAQGHKSPASKTASASRDADLEKRVEPIEALIRRGDPSAVPAVLDALGEEDWRVRSRAMDAAVNAYVAIPESALIEHAQRDPSADVRFLALAGISARIDPAIPQVEAVDPSTARALAREALSDANESVRWQGQQILDALDTKQARPSSDAPQAEVL